MDSQAPKSSKFFLKSKTINSGLFLIIAFNVAPTLEKAYDQWYSEQENPNKIVHIFVKDFSRLVISAIAGGGLYDGRNKSSGTISLLPNKLKKKGN